MTELYLIRHGETEWNRAGLWQGHEDSPLTENGVEQAQSLGARFAQEELHFDAIYSSDLGRAYRTCEYLVEPLGQRGDIKIETDLRERALGNLQGLTFAQIEAEHPEDAVLHASGDPHYAPEGGESWADTFARASAALRRIVRRHDGQRVLAVSHGGVIGMALRDALGLNLLPPRRFQLPNTAVNIFQFADHNWTLRTWGDTAHLKNVTVLDEVVK
ncbi:histidine phosphatase family protein [Roseibacillus ishigakijimensis]|uniref:Histidine phosphatase family protein n=1 Tax=Roseibacillus ishigakijimensis TaxID=454146 RepID=A0A934RLG3_9BACT|nr:histidine phosphatase family protein [Roseibacillus ishigakijimensis]MBK1833018.1 histidine phosphatase family protein [Roseibacillus ishigakijimensis]